MTTRAHVYVRMIMVMDSALSEEREMLMFMDS